MTDDRHGYEPPADLFDERPASPIGLAARLMDVLRGVGVQRGMEVALTALFLRWHAVEENAHSAWEELVSAKPGEHQLWLFESLMRSALPGLVLPRPGAFDVAVHALPSVLRQVNDAVPMGEPRRAAAMTRDTFEALLALSSSQSREAGEFETPREVADLLVRLVGSDGQTVLDPACGVGNTLLRAAQRAGHPVRAIGVDVNPDLVRQSWMRLTLSEVDVKVLLGDAFRVVSEFRADAVVLQPPWGLKLSEEQRASVGLLRLQQGYPTPEAILRGDMPWLFLAQQALFGGGRAAIVLTHSSLSGGRHTAAHEALLHEGGVEAIISLPSSGLFSHTSIGTVVWVLRRPDEGPSGRRSVLMADAQHLLSDSGRGALTDDSVEAIVALLTEYRDSGVSAASPHVAKAVHVEDIDLRRGLAPQTYLDPPPRQEVRHPEPDRRLITRLTVENFKAFGASTEIDLAPLTLVFGANSAGKSTLIQALLLLRQSLESDRLVTQGAMADVGSFTGILHRHEPRPMRLGLEYGVLPTWIPADGTPDPALQRAVRWEFTQNVVGQGVLRGLDVRFGRHCLPFTANQQNDDLIDLPLKALDGVAGDIAVGRLLYPFEKVSGRRQDVDEDLHIRQRRSQAASTIKPLRADGNRTLSVRRRGLTPTADPVIPWAATAGLSEARKGVITTTTNRIAQLAAGVAHEVRSLLDGVVYLGPLRSAPQRFYDRAASSANPGDGHHVAMFLFDNTSVIEHVNAWLELLEVPYTVDVLPVQTPGVGNLVGDLVAISLTDRRSGVSVTPADVGFGISQMLPVIVELLSRRESVVCIEQPETHLHPRLQARLADLFIEASNEEGRGNQVIVETHSEHLILRVQRRVREGSLDPAAVSVVYVDQREDGHTVVKQLRLDDDGNFLDEWPHGFFDERLEELFGNF